MVTTLRVGGDHSRVMDETIALNAGVIGQETTGVGGFSMAVRTIPILLEYCRLINEIAPNAWIFNFTNPSGLVTQALKSAGYEKVIGICDAPSSTKFRMAAKLGVDEKDLYVEFFGLNHLSWIRSVKIKDEEILPRLLADDAFLKSIQEFSMFDPDLLRMIGFLPNEYLYYYYHREKALANILKSGATRGQTIEQVNKQMMEELKAMDMDADPEGALQIFLYYMQGRPQDRPAAGLLRPLPAGGGRRRLRRRHRGGKGGHPLLPRVPELLRGGRPVPRLPGSQAGHVGHLRGGRGFFQRAIPPVHSVSSRC